MGAMDEMDEQNESDGSGRRSTDPRRFPILYTGANRAMTVLGLRRENSFVDVSASEVSVRMGWAFRATVPRSSIATAALDTDRVSGWGAHGWGGRWLVNGSSSNIVRIEIEPEARGRTAGFSVRLRTLRVSVEDPDGLVDLLADRTD